jgi:hypothetical protein
MQLSFDPAKSAKNIAERGLPFDRVADLEWETAVLIEDTRKDYGERRVQVFARLAGRLHVAVITMREDTTHVISFRRANRKERTRYEKANL